MQLFKRFWTRWVRRVRDEYEETQDDMVHSSPPLRLLIWALSGYCLLVMVLAVYWGISPQKLDSRVAIGKVLAEQHLAIKGDLPAGAVTTASIIAITENLWHKPGGYIANDLLPPGLFSDDMAHWEFGVLVQVRDITHVLRTSFSQTSGDIIIDEDLQKAEVRLNFDSNSWIFPSSESQYAAGVVHLKKYLIRLLEPDVTHVNFYADAQHLNDYLAGVEQRLKNLSQRLTASVGPNTNTDSAALPITQTSSNALYIKTPWLQLDDVFYEARGYSWALIALLHGMEMDFSSTLIEKNAQDNFEQIIRELEATQQNIYSPIILNGDGFGFLANHSLVMASYLARAQITIADCRRLLLKPSFSSSL